MAPADPISYIDAEELDDNDGCRVAKV